MHRTLERVDILFSLFLKNYNQAKCWNARLEEEPINLTEEKKKSVWEHHILSATVNGSDKEITYVQMSSRETIQIK